MAGRLQFMENTGDQAVRQLDAALDAVATPAAAAGGYASTVLEVVAQIDGLRDRLEAARMELLHGAELVREPGLSVAERLHATNDCPTPTQAPAPQGTTAAHAPPTPPRPIHNHNRPGHPLGCRTRTPSAPPGARSGTY